MFGKKKEKKKSDTDSIQKVPLQDISYPPKIILAWAKALDGHKEISSWLLDNGYKELVMANSAINLKNEARDWLVINGFPHLMAMINACEGNKNAQNWLLRHNFVNLYHMALAIDGDDDSWEWIGDNLPVDVFLLTQTIMEVKDGIEENHKDVHSFGKD